MGWKMRGYVGLDRDACMPQWAGIMKLIDEGPRKGAMVKIDESTTIGSVLEAAQRYATEGLQRLQEDGATMVDGYSQPEAPWSSRRRRRETAGGFKGDSMER
jgi:hypothetical protein